MLSRLFVKNYAIIDESEVIFKDKLNILTGETGAGKSILIGSVNAALGQRTSKDVIRHGADYCTVELVFSGLPERTTIALSALDIFPDDGEIVISRKITNAGKSICKINGETVSLEELKNCSSLLLDIHGQNENHSLLKNSNHLKLIDKFTGEEASDLLLTLKERYAAYSEVKKEIRDVEALGNSKDTDVNYLEYALNEIEAAKPEVGEDEELEKEYRALSNSKQIAESLSSCIRLTEDDESGGVSELLSGALRELSRAAEYDNSLYDLSALLENASELVSDFRRKAEDYVSSHENSEQRFSEVSERLDTLNSLKKKYGGPHGSIEAVLKYAENAAEMIEKLSDSEEYLKGLKEKEEKIRKECIEISEKLSNIRKKAAEGLCKRISEELKDLNFAKAEFKCDFERKEDFNSEGFDRAEFIISFNPGEPARPLVKVASGGELSRVMLAIKTVLADKDEIPTLIFDEIDAGISGRTAQKVSEKLGLLSRSHQVICITHLAQIAAMADTHFIIEKESGDENVRTCVRELSDEDRKTEIARILGGAEITDNVMKSSEEMIILAKKLREGFQ